MQFGGTAYNYRRGGRSGYEKIWTQRAHRQRILGLRLLCWEDTDLSGHQDIGSGVYIADLRRLHEHARYRYTERGIISARWLTPVDLLRQFESWNQRPSKR